MTNGYYSVIEILDTYSLIINYGKKHGAKKDEKVRIISVGPEIFDPEMNVLLGTLNGIKAELTLSTVYDQFSICKKILIETSNVLVSPLSAFTKTSSTSLELPVDTAQITNKKIPDDNIIRVGDFVDVK